MVVSGVEPARPVPLPAVPAEYVEFDQLLLESMFSTRYNTNIPPSFTLSLCSDPLPVGDNILISQPRVANKRTVTDLPTWLEGVEHLCGHHCSTLPCQSLCSVRLPANNLQC